MKKNEILLFVLIAFAIYMKFSPYPGGDEMIMLSLTLLAVFYFAFGFLLFNNIRLRRVFKSESYQDITTLRAIGAVGLGIALSQICIGIVFKVLDFAGADEMLLIGVPFVSIIFIVALIRYMQTKNTRYYAPIVIRIFVFGSIGVLMLMTSSLSIIKLQYRDHPAYIKAYEAYIADRDNDELAKKLDMERNRIRLTDEEFQRYYGEDKK